jgi:hypothetical protein
VPVVINDLFIDVEDAPGARTESPPQTRSPVSISEYEVLAMLAVVEERKLRLAVD